MYTFVVRSKDRLHGATNDFYVNLGFQPELSKHDYWKISVQRVIIPKSDAYTVYYDSTTNTYTQPANNGVIAHEYVEMHLDFGSACKGHDTDINGGRVVHIISSSDVIASPIFESKPNEAVAYEIVRPSMCELRVRLFNKDGLPAKQMKPGDFPNAPVLTRGLMYNVETDLPDWVLILHIEPIEQKNNIYT